MSDLALIHVFRALPCVLFVAFGLVAVFRQRSAK
jgi:hypothetical protein